jgi:hypothetical protein
MANPRLDIYGTSGIDPRIVVGGIVAVGLIGGAVYACTPKARLWMAETIAGSLPTEEKQQYITGLFVGSAADGSFPAEKVSYACSTTISALPAEAQVQTLETVVDKMASGPRKEIAIYSIEGLGSGDQLDVIAKTGRDVLENFFNGIGSAWDDFITYYVDKGK